MERRLRKAEKVGKGMGMEGQVLGLSVTCWEISVSQFRPEAWGWSALWRRPVAMGPQVRLGYKTRNSVIIVTSTFQMCQKWTNMVIL